MYQSINEDLVQAVTDEGENENAFTRLQIRIRTDVKRVCSTCETCLLYTLHLMGTGDT